MTRTAIPIAEELGKTRAFAWAIDWPGWCRSAKDPLLLPAAMAGAAPRYALVAAEAGLELGVDPLVELIETVEGSASTDFGVPGSVAESDRRPSSAADAARLARIVQAAWIILDRIVAGAPAELRKGPRGGGRDRDRMVAHCVSSDSGYAAVMGLHLPEPAPTDRPAVEAVRRAMLLLLDRPADGSPLAGRRWPPRYAARRIAWHALDHAWEIQDKSDPAGGMAG